jgi:L-cysteine S-thiosulfotransferase
MKTNQIALMSIALVALSTVATAAETAKPTQAEIVMKASFKDRGQAKVDRLNQDETQRLCSQYPEKRPPEIAKKIQAINMKLIKYPVDGKLLGDWREGEKIAQSGVGKQFSDNPAQPAGGNCYACHQLTKEEISFGNIGPSLYNYGKLRGNTDAIQKYTFAKIYNAEAYVACTNMPRFGHNGILTEEQIRHVAALLLDPNSPVNK